MVLDSAETKSDTLRQPNSTFTPSHPIPYYNIFLVTQFNFSIKLISSPYTELQDKRMDVEQKTSTSLSKTIKFTIPAIDKETTHIAFLLSIYHLSLSHSIIIPQLISYPDTISNASGMFSTKEANRIFHTNKTFIIRTIGIYHIIGQRGSVEHGFHELC